MRSSLTLGLISAVLFGPSAFGAEAQTRKGLEGLSQFRVEVLLGTDAAKSNAINREQIKSQLENDMRSSHINVSSDAGDDEVPSIILYIEIVDTSAPAPFCLDLIVRNRVSTKRDPGKMILADVWRRSLFGKLEVNNAELILKSEIGSLVKSFLDEWTSVNNMYLITRPRGGNLDRIVAACDGSFDANKSDNIAYFRAVCSSFGVVFGAGDPPGILDAIKVDSKWAALNNDLAEAKIRSLKGQLVIGYLKNQFVIVVAGPSADTTDYPFAYWGRTNGVGKKFEKTSILWDKCEMSGVQYFCREIP